MYKSFIILILALLFFLPASASAQVGVGFDTLDVSIWPEYDTPTALVIYKISLAPQTPLPAEIFLRLPASITDISAVAVGESFEAVSDQGVDYKFTPGTEFSQLTVSAAARFIQVEYYDPALNKQGNERQYEYQWVGDNTVNNFRFEFRQPLQSSGLSTEPPLSNAIVDAQGFQFSDFKKTGLKFGDKLTFKIRYLRETDSPSTSFLNVQPSAPLTQTLPGQSNWTTYLPIGLGGLGVALLVVAGWTYWTSSRNHRADAAVRRRHAGRGSADSSGDSQQQVHCSQCGKRTQPGDRFCRVCGSRIRRTEE